MKLHSKASIRLGTLLTAAIAMFAALTMISSVASAKDRDGSRMRGKSLTMGKKVKDGLDGSKDRADWRYVELKKGGKLTLVVTLTPNAKSAVIRITDAKGNVLSESKKGGATRTLTIKAQPGIYYLEVAAGDKVTYTLVASTK